MYKKNSFCYLVNSDLGRWRLLYSDAILWYVNYLYKNLNVKHFSLGVFVDLKWAFDTLNLRVLQSKLAGALWYQGSSIVVVCILSESVRVGVSVSGI